MIPVFGCEGVACFVAIAWNSEHMAEFLAWWMPLNLVCFYAVSFSMAYRNGALYREDRQLWHHLLMTVAFIPTLIGLFLFAIFLLLTEDYRHNRRVIRNHKKEPVK